MSKKNNVMMPSGMAGLTRYGDEMKNEIKIKPKQLLILIGMVIAIEFALRFV